MGAEARARCPFLWLAGLLQVGYFLLTGVTVTFPVYAHASSFTTCPYMSAARGVGSAIGRMGGAAGASQAVQRFVGGQPFPYPLLSMPSGVGSAAASSLVGSAATLSSALQMRGGQSDTDTGGFYDNYDQQNKNQWAPQQRHWQRQRREQVVGNSENGNIGQRTSTGTGSGMGGRAVVMHVGISHKDAAVGLREKLATSEEQLNALAASLCGSGGCGGNGNSLIREAMVLSTCNRFEIYVATTDPAAAAEQIYKVLSDRTRKAVSAGSSSGAVPVDLLRRTMHVVVGDSAVATHLFRVASGLDSIVLGEPQVLGQVRTAWDRASDVARGGRAGRLLSRLFGAAFRAVGRVRSETALSRGSMSVSSTAAGFAAGRLVADTGIPGGMSKARIVVVGSGKMARLLVQNLALRGVREVTMVCRSTGKVAELQKEVGQGMRLLHRPMAELTAAIAAADVLFPCTSAPEPIVTPEMLRTALAGPMRVNNPTLASVRSSSSSGSGRQRRGTAAGMDDVDAPIGGVAGTSAAGSDAHVKTKALLQIVDISVPRNVHADCAALAVGGGGSGLIASYNVDDLKSIMAANAAMRAGEVRHAETIVAEEVGAYSNSAGTGAGCVGSSCGKSSSRGSKNNVKRGMGALRSAAAGS